MAKPRIFISSTFYDFRQIRNDLEAFIYEVGYIPVRNETGSIPYGNEFKLEEYCYHEIREIDILVGIIGGRFGSEADNGNYSITQMEIKTAIEQNKQVYIFIEKNVLTEFEIYLLNKDTSDMKYKFADDLRVYQFIEEVFSLPKNNIITPFESANEIVSFLKEQWAGLFRDLLNLRTRRGQYESVSQKVNELTATAETLQNYLEAVLQKVIPQKDEANSIITKEREKLEQVHLNQKLQSLHFIIHLQKTHGLTLEQAIHAIRNNDTISTLKEELSKIAQRNKNFTCMNPIIRDKNFESLNSARILLEKPIYPSQK